MKAIAGILSLIIASVSFAQNNYTQYVNPFVGTAGHGHTFPGATLPFAMVQLSPDTRIDGSWDGCSGYHYSDSIIYGFSHTHLSGTGCSDYGDIAFMPSYEDPRQKKGISSSKFSHKKESAAAGYYSVQLDNGIHVELSASTRAGIQKYTSSKTAMMWVTLNLRHRDELLAGTIRSVTKNSFQGLRRSKAWAVDQLLYYYFESSRPADEIVIVEGKEGQTHLYLGFNMQKGASLMIKTALSSVDEEGAKNNLKKEMPAWDFARIRKDADKTWNKELKRIKVYGGTLKEKKSFYTALYHCMIHPSIMNDADGRYRGRDNKVHQADGFNYYTVFSLWDTHRALHPLLNLIDKKRSRDFIMTFKAQYEQSGRMPMWELWGNETDCMIGFHSVSVIWNAYLQKVISKEDLKSLWPAVKAEAQSDRFGLDEFRGKGFLSIEDEHESVSKTIEYSYNMYCVSEIASRCGDEELAQEYWDMANGWRNLRDLKSGFMVPRSNGGWIPDFDPRQVNQHFTEANAWQYTFSLSHDLEREEKMQLLAALFNTDSKTSGREQVDITGLIGQYAHGNEPSHHFAYLFENIDSTAKYVKKICNEFYNPEPDGLCGNEDCGQMSAWYVFSAMGFYPADPSSPEMVYGNMLFDSVRFVQGDQTAVIHKKRKAGSEYLKSPVIKFFGQSPVYYHGYENALYDMQVQAWYYVNAPVIHSKSKVFSDSMLVSIESNFRFPLKYSMYAKMGHRIHYTLDGSEPGLASPVYLPGTNLSINRACTLKAVNIAGEKSSHSAIAVFRQFYNSDDIQLQSVYDPQYNAGGNRGLLNGIYGDADWRKGDWQGYQGQDLVLTIDRKTSKPLSTVSLGVLQDTRSWILYPRKIIIYGSNDGVNFEKAGEYLNTVPDQMMNSQRMDMSVTCNGSSYRYVRLVAENYGKLPEWHPGAGGEAYIFTDEIEIR